MAKGWKKGLKITGMVLGGLVALVVIMLVIFWAIQPLLYDDYYEEAAEEFLIDGLSDGIVPQGFCLIDEDTYAYCGYMADGQSASRIYLLDPNGESSRYVELYTADGNPYTGHTGGLTVGESLVWLANDGDGDDNCVWVLDKQELLEPGTEQIVLDNKFYSESRAACCTVDNGILWVGEFYDTEKYPTKESHHLTAPDGTENPAFICGYVIDEASPTGIVGDVPTKILSVSEKLQGFAINDNGEFVLSTSYGLASSHLWFHENVLSAPQDTTVTIDGTEVPVWFLDGESLTKSVELPPMSEELVYKDGRVYILYESASQKYLFGILMRGRYIYSYPF